MSRDVLTDTEISYIACRALGMTNSEASHVMDRSEKTLKNVASSLFSKLNATCATDSVIKALRLGVIPLDEAGLRWIVSECPKNKCGNDKLERVERKSKFVLRAEENARNMDRAAGIKTYGGCAP